IYPKAVYAVHLDHGNEEHVFDAIGSGDYQSVMIDASHDDFQTNVSRTRKVVEKAHSAHIAVEAELGILSGIEDDLEVSREHSAYTRPSEVVEFVEATGCDSLAVAVGTSHGAYKFSGDQGIQFDILGESQRRLDGFPIVLHGGSAVNVEESERINAAAGKLVATAAAAPATEVVSTIER